MRSPAADAVASQQASASNEVFAARHAAGEQGTVSHLSPATLGDAAASRKRTNSQKEGGPTGNTSKKLHVDAAAAPFSTSAGPGKGFK